MFRPARSYIKKKAAAPRGFAIIPVPASTNWCHAHTSHGAFLWLNLMPVTSRFSKSSEEPAGSTGAAERLYSLSAQRTSVPTKDLSFRHFSLLFRCTRALAAAVQPCMMH